MHFSSVVDRGEGPKRLIIYIGLVHPVCCCLSPHQKQLRKSKTSVEVQAIYYVMEGVIYQTPTVQKLIKSRLNKFTHHLNNAFGKVAGFTWRCISYRSSMVSTWFLKMNSPLGIE